MLRKDAERAIQESHTRDLPEPWQWESPLTEMLMVDGSPNGKSRFFKIDTWHNLHLGIGKSWIASCILLLQAILPGGRLEERMATLSDKYSAFCREKKLPKLVTKLDKFLFGGGSIEPIGSWSKAALTSNLMLFVENFCDEYWDEVHADNVLHCCVTMWWGLAFFCLLSKRDGTGIARLIGCFVF